MAEWLPLPKAQWDKLRLPVPGFVPKPNGARYTISLAGRVRRDCGLLWQPTSIYSTTGLPTSLIVRLGGGKSSKSMAKLMHEAFAESRELPTDHPTQSERESCWRQVDGVRHWRREEPAKKTKWIPWLVYSAEIDTETNERCCNIDNVVLAPFFQVVTWTRGNHGHGPPMTREFSAIGRDIPIPRQTLLDAGYKFPKGQGYAELSDATGSNRISKVHIAC